MLNLQYGTFQMLRPIFSRKGYWIVGAMVGTKKGMSYTKRVSRVEDVAKANEQIKLQIMKEHPGIVERNFHVQPWADA